MTPEQAHALLTLASQYGSARHIAATALLTAPEHAVPRSEEADDAYAALSAAIWALVEPA